MQVQLPGLRLRIHLNFNDFYKPKFIYMYLINLKIPGLCNEKFHLRLFSVYGFWADFYVIWSAELTYYIIRSLFLITPATFFSFVTILSILAYM